MTTCLKDYAWGTLDSHAYTLNAANQRTQHTFASGDYWDYSYDCLGQLKSATGKESGGTTRVHEKFGYAYDAGNLTYRTNNAMVQTFGVNSLNELTSVSRSGTITVAGMTSSGATNVSVNASSAPLYADKTFAREGLSLSDGTNTFTAVALDASGRSATNSVSAWLPASASYTYDDNGNLTSDGRRGFAYDAYDRLTQIVVTNAWKSEFVYDPLGRRRQRKEWEWRGGWVKTAEVRYVHDGNLVVQERDPQNVPQVTYARGPDLSGALDGAVGIGGLSATTRHSPLRTRHYYYFADGNVTFLVDTNQQLAAAYVYDPYGNLLGKSGPLADDNLYRFSSKELHDKSGLVHYLYRYYEPSLKRWTTRDPAALGGEGNYYLFTADAPIALIDYLGLATFNYRYSVVSLAKFLSLPKVGIHTEGITYWAEIARFVPAHFSSVLADDSRSHTCKHTPHVEHSVRVYVLGAGNRFAEDAEGNRWNKLVLPSMTTAISMHEALHVFILRQTVLRVDEEMEARARSLSAAGATAGDCYAKLLPKVNSLEQAYYSARVNAEEDKIWNDDQIDAIDAGHILYDVTGWQIGIYGVRAWVPKVPDTRGPQASMRDLRLDSNYWGDGYWKDERLPKSSRIPGSVQALSVSSE